VSRVRLVTDGDSAVAAETNRGVKGSLVGVGGEGMLFEQILQEKRLEVGDIVVTSGALGNLPSGIVLGKVVEVLEIASAVYKSAKVKPLFLETEVDYVFVLIEE